MSRAILALDQGTTSSRALVFDRGGAVLGLAQRELPQIYPCPGWVEQDPEVIWATQLATAREALAASGLAASGDPKPCGSCPVLSSTLCTTAPYAQWGGQGLGDAQMLVLAEVSVFGNLQRFNPVGRTGASSATCCAGWATAMQPLLPSQSKRWAGRERRHERAIVRAVAEDATLASGAGHEQFHRDPRFVRRAVRAEPVRGQRTDGR
jgi:hypothetical protein